MTASHCIIYKRHIALFFLNTAHPIPNTSLNWILSYAPWLCVEIYCFKVKGEELNYYPEGCLYTSMIHPLILPWGQWELHGLVKNRAKYLSADWQGCPFLSVCSELWSRSTIDTQQWSRTADVPTGHHAEVWTSPEHLQIGARVQGRKLKAGIFILNERCFHSGSYWVMYLNVHLTLNMKTLLHTRRVEVRCLTELYLLNLGLYQDKNIWSTSLY